MTTTFGACSAYTCGGSGLVIPRPPPVSAGAIEVSVGAKSITILPAANGTYPSQMLAGALWAAGDLLTFAAAGDVAPAFTRRVSAPGPPAARGSADGTTFLSRRVPV
jgi:hypothetical protein